MTDIETKKEQLNSQKLAELKELCKERGYEGYSKLSKEEIVDFIIDMEESIAKAVSTIPSKPQRRALRKPSRRLRGF